MVYFYFVGEEVIYGKWGVSSIKEARRDLEEQASLFLRSKGDEGEGFVGDGEIEEYYAFFRNGGKDLTSRLKRKESL